MSNKQQIQKVSWWHERLADWMLANPQGTIKEAAIVFGCHQQTLYIIKASDAFKAYWNFRRRQIETDLTQRTGDSIGGLMEKTAAVAEMAMDQILEQLESNQKAMDVGAPIIPHDELRSTADMAMKKLGYGLAGPAPGAAAVATQTNVSVTIDASLLAAAREKMKQLHGIDVAAPLSIPPPAPTEPVTE